jgi:hypothetical protein
LNRIYLPSVLSMARGQTIMDDFGLHQISIGQRLIAGRVGTPSEQGFVFDGTSLSLCRARLFAQNATPSAELLGVPPVCLFFPFRIFRVFRGPNR